MDDIKSVKSKPSVNFTNIERFGNDMVEMTVSCAVRRSGMFLSWMLMELLLMKVSAARSMSAPPRWFSGQRHLFRSTILSSPFHRLPLHMTTNMDNNPITHNTTTTTTNTTSPTSPPATATSLSSLRQATLSQLLVPSSFAFAALAYVSLGNIIILDDHPEQDHDIYYPDPSHFHQLHVPRLF